MECFIADIAVEEEGFLGGGGAYLAELAVEALPVLLELSYFVMG